MRKRILVLGLVLLCVPSAWAGTLQTPNGNPTGAATAKGTGGSVALNPSPATGDTQPQVGPGSNDDLFIAAMGAQGFNKANGWTFTFTPLVGNDLSLGTYLAWADSRPTVTQGKVSAGGNTQNGKPVSFKGVGGAAIGIGYDGTQDKTGKDPVKNVHWISILEDNKPTGFETANGTADPIRNGFTLSVDNPLAPRDAKGKPTTPFYDAGAAADANSFVDLPSDSLKTPAQLIFHTFIVQETAAKTLTVYDGVNWGFTITPDAVVGTPEPASLLLLATGGGGLAFGAWRRRAQV